MQFSCALIAMWLLVASLTIPAHARRVALVIGNAAYTQGPLANPVNDAEAIGDALRDLGFAKVIRVQNATKAQMEKALGEMATESQGAEVAVVFFAGHGTERDGRNYLIPVDAKLDRASDLDLQAIALPTVLDQIAGATKLKLVILDACRNTIFPLAGNRRSATRGLARIEPEDNTLVAYAAKDGTVAQDGAGAKHSPFTAALLRHLRTTGLEVDYLFRLVRDDVVAATGRAQTPHLYGTLGRERLFLAPAVVGVPTVVPSIIVPSAAPSAAFRGFALTPQVGHATSVNAVAVSPDGRIIVSGGSDNTVKLWEVATGRLLRTLLGHKKEVTNVAFSNDGRSIVSGSRFDSFKVWQAPSGRLIRTLDVSAEKSAAVSPDSREFVTGGFRALRFWEVSSGHNTRDVQAHSGTVRAIAFTPDGLTIISGDAGKHAGFKIMVHAVASGRHIRTLEGHTGGVSSLVVSSDGRSIFSGSWDNTVRLWDAATGRHVRTLEGHSGSVNAVAVTKDARMIVSGSDDGTVKVWEAATGRVLHTLEGHLDKVNAVAFSPDGRTLISGSDDSTVKVWEAATGKLLRTFEPDTNEKPAFAVSPDGRIIISGSGKTVRVWEAASGRLVRSMQGHEARVTDVAFSPDGQNIVSGSLDATLKLWETTSGRQIRTLEGHSGGVRTVVLSSDERAILSLGPIPEVYRWDLATGARTPVTGSGDDWSSVVSRYNSNMLPPSTARAGSTIRLLAPDGSDRARLISLPDNHWAWIAADGLTYTGSQGAEAHLLLVERFGLGHRQVEDAFIKAHKREKLDLGPMPKQCKRCPAPTFWTFLATVMMPAWANISHISDLA